MSERPALEEVFHMTKGAFWYRNLNWCSDISQGKWEGITVDRGGHVWTLDLRNNYLQGSLESAQFLPRLVNLNTLTLSGNSISGSIPRCLTLIQSLQVLDLSWNKLSGMLNV